MHTTMDASGRYAHISIPSLHSIDTFDFTGSLILMYSGAHVVMPAYSPVSVCE